MRDFRSPAYTDAGPDPASLLARRVAREIQGWIIRKDLPVGAFLGREADLQTLMNVSRPTLRAAIRYLEIAGHVATKAGVGGGVFVGDMSQSPAIVALSRHIVMLGQPLPLFFSVYMPFFAKVAVLAAANASDSQRSKISNIATRMELEEDCLAAFRPSRLELRTHILEATGCPAIELVGAALFTSYTRILEGELKLGETEHEKVRIVKQAEARFITPLVNGDRDATLSAFSAAAKLERAITMETIIAGMLPERSIPETLFAAVPEAPKESKLAEHVIRAMRRDLHHQHAAGTPSIGSISELAVRYGVSQEICREALGLLSLHGLVVIRRGRGGGVFANMPSLRGLEVVIDPELRLCGGLQELHDLLTVIREEFGSEGLLEKDKVVMITFLDELIERVDVANL
ncbi:GntR family transcriptional regulator [Sphingorhabdus sp.]|uniref:GntR family transcriptional regulator n=1 Tax=Sphingorhabdus sp. TaxID=1902408 RepID=UPI0037C558FF